jgi:hypothetical protein
MTEQRRHFNAESLDPQVGEFSIASDDAASPITARKILKVFRNPRLAAAPVNAQLRIRGKARVPLSVRSVQIDVRICCDSRH